VNDPVETIIDGRLVFRVREEPEASDVAPTCPNCKRTADMQPSPFGHQRLLVCDNPPCVYARALARIERPALRVVVA
jgi:ssDNA-binding Zn-finger/Zn-ribbon topoisomerase 1